MRFAFRRGADGGKEGIRRPVQTFAPLGVITRSRSDACVCHVSGTLRAGNMVGWLASLVGFIRGEGAAGYTLGWTKYRMLGEIRGYTSPRARSVIFYVRRIFLKEITCSRDGRCFFVKTRHGVLKQFMGAKVGDEVGRD